MKDTNLYDINGASIGAMINQPSQPMIYFGVTVTEQRAEFLARMLVVPLCKHCGREVSECSASPCDVISSAQKKLFEDKTRPRVEPGKVTETARCNLCSREFDARDLNEYAVCRWCARKASV